MTLVNTTELLDKLQNGVVIIIATLPNGTTQEIQATLQKSLLPVNETTNTTERMLLQENVVGSNSTKLSVWDVGIRSWRQIDARTVRIKN
jgi:hypothetical protein